MATTVKTKPETKPEVVAQASTKVVSAIRALIDAEAKTKASYVALYEATAAEIVRNKYDQDQARLMVRLSYREAFGQKADASADVLKSFDQTKLGDVSRVIRLCYPENAKAGQERDKMIKHNETCAPSERIGVLKIVDAARGKETLANVIGHKRKVKAAAGQAKEEYTLEKFNVDLSALFSKGKKAGLTVEKMADASAELVAQYEADAEEEEKEAAEKAASKKAA